MQQNAKIVGNYFINKLNKLKREFPNFISKISGIGLFIGIDLIADGKLNKPNPKLANKLINKLRNRGILLSTDGPFNNVIKIKPPLVFTKENTNQVCFEIRSFLINEDKK